MSKPLLVIALCLAPHLLPAQAPATPVKHLVVIFDENVSFDHYFPTKHHSRRSRGRPA
jgi:phospholipase C